MSKKTILISLTIVFLHFRLVEIGPKQLSLAIIPMLFFTAKSVKLTARSFLKSILFVFSVIMVLILHSLLASENTQLGWIEFIKSASNIILSLAFVAPFMFSKHHLTIINFTKTLKILLNIIVISLFAQYLLVNFVDPSWINIFRGHQLYYSFGEAYSLRMKSFYLEPSFAGLVLLNIVWGMCYLKMPIKKLTIIKIALGIFLIKSGWLFYCLAVLMVVYYRPIRKVLFYLTPLIIGFLINFDLPLEALKTIRFNEVFENQEKITSGYMRLVLPMQTVYSVLEQGHYLGLGLGHWDIYLLDAWSSFKETSMSNGFFQIIGLFGYLGIIINLYLILGAIYYRKSFGALYLLVILNMLNNGALTELPYVFVMFMLPYFFYLVNEKNTNNHCRLR